MKIVEITYQYRRDFYADFECEGCGHVIHHMKGYDDRFFHDEVVPGMVCVKYGKSRNDLGIAGERVETKYPDGYQV